MQVGGEPTGDAVGQAVEAGEFCIRQKLGVVKALHEESATWLTGDGVAEQRQRKHENPYECHVVFISVSPLNKPKSYNILHTVTHIYKTEYVKDQCIRK